MREEYVKSSGEWEGGVKVFNLGDEYVFTLKDKKGKEIEYHLTKPNMHELKSYIEEKKKELESAE